MKIEHIETNEEVMVIAEIGNNHEGNLEIACEMIKQAAWSGVHAVKFQKINPDFFVAASNQQRYRELKSYEFSNEQWKVLHQEAERNSIMFMATPFDLESAGFLNDLVPAFKIASGDNNFYPLLQRVASFGKPIILSCGLLNTQELLYSKLLIEKEWRSLGIEQELATLHCVVSYPTPLEEANLSFIQKMKHEIGGTVGYSDHTLGIEAAYLSVALGARIIEKHFTLDKNYSDFRDHQLSATPDEMKELMTRIDTIEKMMGTGNKRFLEIEKSTRSAVRRSIVAAKDLTKGTILNNHNITWMRPQRGLAPGQEAVVLGKTLNQDLTMGDVITESAVN